MKLETKGGVEVKERPILFSGPMVRAILEGRKTMTRRVVKPQPELNTGAGGQDCTQRYNWKGIGTAVAEACETWNNPDMLKLCQYGNPGDRLWVRETFMVQPEIWALDHGPQPVHYSATSKAQQVEDYKAKPSIHMPRWACRITLEITGVRVERLASLTLADAVKEGVEKHTDGISYKDYTDTYVCKENALQSFESLWKKINGWEAWDKNPWVWVVEFVRVES